MSLNLSNSALKRKTETENDQLNLQAKKFKPGNIDLKEKLEYNALYGTFSFLKGVHGFKIHINVKCG